MFIRFKWAKEGRAERESMIEGNEAFQQGAIGAHGRKACARIGMGERKLTGVSMAELPNEECESDRM